jgi:hypothetical protein
MPPGRVRRVFGSYLSGDLFAEVRRNRGDFPIVSFYGVRTLSVLAR